MTDHKVRDFCQSFVNIFIFQVFQSLWEPCGDKTKDILVQKLCLKKQLLTPRLRTRQIKLCTRLSFPDPLKNPTRRTVSNVCPNGMSIAPFSTASSVSVIAVGDMDFRRNWKRRRHQFRARPLPHALEDAI